MPGVLRHHSNSARRGRLGQPAHITWYAAGRPAPHCASGRHGQLTAAPRRAGACLLMLLTCAHSRAADAMAARPRRATGHSLRLAQGSEDGRSRGRGGAIAAGAHGADGRAGGRPAGRAQRRRPRPAGAARRGAARVRQQPPAATHHIYRPGLTADSCNASTFPAGAGYWTDAGARLPGTALFGTGYAQAAIWAHQHPADCAAARFLLFTPQMGGLGSMVHNHGAVLGLALATGRVLVYEFDPAHAWHDARWCAGRLPFDACYFQPVSNCTPAHAAAGAPGGSLAGAPLFDWRVPGQDAARALRFYRNESYHGVDTYAVLPQFRQLIAASPVDPAKYHYWWRAQAAAYLLRPNARTLAAIARRRAAAFAGRTIAPGTVSVHVRKGDKWIEAPEAPLGDYVAAAERLVAGAGGRLGRRIFLSTEDPDATAYFGALAPAWAAAWTDGPRKPDRTKSTLAYVAEVRARATLGPAPVADVTRAQRWAPCKRVLVAQKRACRGSHLLGELGRREPGALRRPCIELVGIHCMLG